MIVDDKQVFYRTVMINTTLLRVANTVNRSSWKLYESLSPIKLTIQTRSECAPYHDVIIHGGIGSSLKSMSSI